MTCPLHHGGYILTLGNTVPPACRVAVDNQAFIVQLFRFFEVTPFF